MSATYISIMSKKSPPKTLYRYRGFSASTLDSLCRDRLFFADPNTFNDPLECKPSIECNSDIDELRKILTILIEERVSSEVLSSLKNAGVSDWAASTHAHKEASSRSRNKLSDIRYNATGPDWNVSEVEAEKCLLTSAIEREIHSHYDSGVCCFSTTYKNPLLWSHYGEQHKGICIGYSMDRKPSPEPLPVDYGGNRSIQTSLIGRALIEKDSVSKRELYEITLLRKARSWVYEHEWRLIGNQGDQLSPLLMKDITFGLKCPRSLVHTVVSMLSSRKPALRYYEMYEVRGEFSIRRREVDLGELSMFMPVHAASPEEIFPNITRDQ